MRDDKVLNNFFNKAKKRHREHRAQKELEKEQKRKQQHFAEIERKLLMGEKYE